MALIAELLLSLLVWPTLFVHGPAGRWANLLLPPPLCGLMMSAIGAWMQRHDRTPARLDGFLFGTLFAFGMRAVRFAFGH